jgi:hypothetical protein
MTCASLDAVDARAPTLPREKKIEVSKQDEMVDVRPGRTAALTHPVQQILLKKMRGQIPYKDTIQSVYTKGVEVDMCRQPHDP